MNFSSERVELKREVEAIQIPSGDTITLPAGLPVMITQNLFGPGAPRGQRVGRVQTPIHTLAASEHFRQDTGA